MYAVFVRRLIQSIPVVFVTIFAVFILTAVLPGDAALTVAGEAASPAQVAQVRAELGLDRNVLLRFWEYLLGLVKGDFGASLRTGESVSVMLLRSIPVTVQLTIVAMLLGVIFGVPAGVISAVKDGKPADNTLRVFAVFGIAVPHFWLALMLILVFALILGWFPASGYVSFAVSPVENLRYMFLPAIAIATGFFAIIVRQTRASLVNVLDADYMRTATSKGISRTRVVFSHGLRNALLPVVTVVGLQTGALLGGAVIVETIFSLPGLGAMLVNGIYARDIPVIQGAVLTVVVAVIVVNLITDVLYGFLDPRVEVS